jgi:EAL domain-containing protein (putative c-di-GMP-specific phosphodiesterase class I)
MAILVGLLLVIASGYASVYLLQMNKLKNILAPIPIPYEFVVISGVYLITFILFYIIIKKTNIVSRELLSINNMLQQFLKQEKIEIPTLKHPSLQQIATLIQEAYQKYNEMSENSTKKINTYKEIADSMLDIFDLEKVLVAKVNQDGKIIKANKRLLKFLAFESEVKLNMNVKNFKDIFDQEVSNTWLNDFLDKKNEVMIKKVKFIIYVEKVQRLPEYVITLIDITEIEEERAKLEYERNYVNNNLKTFFALNKSFEITLIRVTNYENYAINLGTGILELFQEEFVKKIKSLGYDEVFMIQNDIFAIYGIEKNEYNQYKKILEETIQVEVGDDIYLFNPKIVLGGGVNFEQARQQLFESTNTFISKVKEDVKYNPEFIKLLNKSILNQKIILSYTPIENHKNTIIVEPIIKDEYSNTPLNKELIINIAQEFNLYLLMIKILLLNNISLLKDQKIIINVTTTDLLATTILTDLLTLIKREELNVVFNIEVNSKYSVVFPLLKTIKSYAQIGLRKVGKGYISFRDVYALKVEYLEIDDTIIDLVDTNPQWKFLLDAVKIIIKGQKSKLIARNYSDNKILKISNNSKMFDM